MELGNFRKLLSLFLLIKLLQLLIVYYAPLQFDTSSQILLDNHLHEKHVFADWIADNVLNKLVVWDAVYFINSATNGVVFEHEHVFGPLWWRLLSIVPGQNLYIKLAVGLVINNLCHFGSCIVMYYLTKRVFPAKKELERYAYMCSVLVILQPSGIFTTTIYTESTSQFLCFLGLYLRQRGRDTTNSFWYLLSGILFAISFGFRSNSLLYGIVYLNDLCLCMRHRRFFRATICVAGGIPLAFVLALSIYMPYRLYCPERGEWCESYTKSLTSYAQSHYWNVGFLRYFTMGNIPLFIMAGPSLVILGASINHLWGNSRAKPIVLMSAVYLFFQFTSFHVQIVNRVMSFTPIHIWFVGSLIRTKPIFGRLIVQWWIVWTFVQTGLYACFLPPA